MALIRRRHVGDGMQEHLELDNHGLEARRRLEIIVLFDADFADLFEVKDELAKVGELYRRVEHERRDARLRARATSAGRPTSSAAARSSPTSR